MLNNFLVPVRYDLIIFSIRSFLRITLPLPTCLLVASSFARLGIFGAAWNTDACKLRHFWITASKSDLQKDEGEEVVYNAFFFLSVICWSCYVFQLIFIKRKLT